MQEVETKYREIVLKVVQKILIKTRRKRRRRGSVYAIRDRSRPSFQRHI